jgi:hypothetical protein
MGCEKQSIKKTTKEEEEGDEYGKRDVTFTGREGVRSKFVEARCAISLVETE